MINRLTLLACLFPQRFIDTDIPWTDDRFEDFHRRYEWDLDEWGGLRDTVSPIEETLETGHGDCDDYAFVSASYLAATTDDPVRVAVLANDDGGHVVCYTGNRVYSSGEIHHMSFRRYCAEQNFRAIFTRSVR